ncbi:MAG: hypothetical protein IJ723_06120, partial [Ruminococcus sp.]|nr:hypothetical protein [Ruminococcus sp.]
MPYRSTPNKLPIRRIKRRTIIFFTLSTIIIVLGIAFSMFVTLAKISDQKESKLMESSATELTLVMNNYLEERESECNDVFRNEVISSYAPFVNTTGETEFDREQHKSNVKKELSNISAGKGYNDFFIVYSTSEAVGNVSQGAFELVSTKGYQAYSDMLGGAGDLWSFGDLLGPNKLFYLRRMNDSSIFVMSCYIDNLEKIFPANDKVSIVEYILADENEKVIISDLKDVKTGEKVPERYTSLFKSGNEAVVDDFYTGAKTVMNCGWYVY